MPASIYQLLTIYIVLSHYVSPFFQGFYMALPFIFTTTQGYSVSFMDEQGLEPRSFWFQFSSNHYTTMAVSICIVKNSKWNGDDTKMSHGWHANVTTIMCRCHQNTDPEITGSIGVFMDIGVLLGKATGVLFYIRVAIRSMLPWHQCTVSVALPGLYTGQWGASDMAGIILVSMHCCQK